MSTYKQEIKKRKSPVPSDTGFYRQFVHLFQPQDRLHQFLLELPLGESLLRQKMYQYFKLFLYVI